jgi:hypothetical protein
VGRQGALASLRCLDGRWRGSGGGYAAFFEEYRFVDDSTLEQRTFADSTFTVTSDSSVIEARGGQVTKRRGNALQHVLVRVTGDTLRFERPAGSHTGFTWVRQSADAWRAYLDGRAGAAPTVYVLRRLRVSH